MIKLKLYTFNCINADYDVYVDGVIITTSLERAWELFFETYSGEIGCHPYQYYARENWTCDETEIKDGDDHWGFNAG